MIQTYIAEQLQNPKVGAVVAAAATSSGIASSVLNFIPDNIIKLSTLMGTILAFVLIIVHVAKEARDRKEYRLRVQKVELENLVLRQQLKAGKNDSSQ